MLIMLINVFGVWINPALVRYLVADGGGGCWVHFGHEDGVRFDKHREAAVATEINRLVREAARPPRPLLPHPQTGAPG